MQNDELLKYCRDILAGGNYFPILDTLYKLANEHVQRLEAEEAFGHISRVNPDDPNTQPEIPSYESIAEMLPSILSNASAHCPICGVYGTHKHPPVEMVIYRNGVKYGCSLHGTEEAKTGDAEMVIEIVNGRLKHWRTVCQRDFDAGTTSAHNMGRRAEAAVILDALLARLNQGKRSTNAPVGVPDGWKPVPATPTEIMCSAYFSSIQETGMFTEAYKAMINAAPQPPNSDSPSPSGEKPG